MPLRLADSARNAAVNGVVDLLDVGGAGSIKIYTGSQPATPATGASGTLLATITLVSTAFGASSSGSAALADPASVNAVATGTAGWARFADGAGAVVMDGNVTATGGGGVVELSTVSLVSGNPVDITGGTYTQPM
jgi:hypothetical protein